MKMDNIGSRLSEDSEKVSRCLGQMPARLCLYGEPLFQQLFAERAKSGDRINTGVVTLLSQHAAHLCYERLGSATSMLSTT